MEIRLLGFREIKKLVLFVELESKLLQKIKDNRKDKEAEKDCKRFKEIQENNTHNRKTFYHFDRDLQASINQKTFLK